MYICGALVAQMVKNLPAVWETWVLSLGQEDTLEKGMSTHGSILAWRIPWTEVPSRLQSMGSQRVEHGWLTKTFTFISVCICTLTLSLSYLCVYMYILFFFTFSFIIGYYRVLNIVPCAIQWVFLGYLFYT